MFWRPAFEVDLGRVLSPLKRGRGSLNIFDDDRGVTWLASNTPDGPGTLALRRLTDGRIEAAAWGDGKDRLLSGVPALLGAEDDDSEFVAHHDVVARARREHPGLRLGRTGVVWDWLVLAVLEQKVAGKEAIRSWAELCRRFGARPPGPAPERLRLPPTPVTLRSLPDWHWHRAGVDIKRRTTLLNAARVAGHLERAVELGGLAGRHWLRRVPGIGVWTAAEIAQRAWGDPDAVSFGDYNIPSMVGHAVLGVQLDDAGMAEVLAPYAPQRQRAVRYLETAGHRRPRFGPRIELRDYRAM
ncbi:DNA-3-methyladenine glycosylase family protein [Amycolatopsis australiensis]|uniref:3-methyladenine DNA glycosylase/8-oxoguanine DNA glycosylase n=1 Tax=Amycolatopsis australiensis TaxID=546364 RepID=A0A1K1P4V0_9PSEU|nr:3-methyladenine DNA glycosylase [Amycolatopsis australiensis]SFW42784.1 3-methyladenine DNA glycosylase/8-oxoguanine DNA glycosylase [Amycolatopsis australiensis]